MYCLPVCQPAEWLRFPSLVSNGSNMGSGARMWLNQRESGVGVSQQSHLLATDHFHKKFPPSTLSRCIKNVTYSCEKVYLVHFCKNRLPSKTSANLKLHWTKTPGELSSFFSSLWKSFGEELVSAVTGSSFRPAVVSKTPLFSLPLKLMHNLGGCGKIIIGGK